MKKILFAIWPALGHVRPALELAKRLKQENHEVIFYTSKAYSNKIEKEGIRFYPFDNQKEFTGETLNEVFPEYFKINKAIDKFRWGVDNIIAPTLIGFTKDLEKIIEVEKPDLMVVDPTMTAVVPLKRKGIKIPIVGLGILPLSVTSKNTAPFGLAKVPKKGLINTIYYQFLNNYVQHIIFGKQQKTFDKYMKQLGLKQLEYFYLDSVQLYCDYYLQGTIKEFEYPRTDLSKNTKFVGPFINDTYQNNYSHPIWWKELYNGKQNILLTQGTLDNNDFDNIILPSIEAFKNEKVNIIVTTGNHELSSNERKLFDDAGVLYDKFIPYEELLPFIDVMVTNSGYGGVQQAIFYEVLLISLGTSEDKPEVGARIKYSNVGINISEFKLSPHKINEAYHTLENSKVYTEQLVKLSNQMKQNNGYSNSILIINSKLRGEKYEKFDIN